MKSIEFLRGKYIASGLCIKPKTQVSKIDALKKIIRAWGLNPDEILAREAQSRGNITVLDNQQFENTQIRQLSSALQNQMLKALREEKNVGQ